MKKEIPVGTVHASYIYLGEELGWVFCQDAKPVIDGVYHGQENGCWVWHHRAGKWVHFEDWTEPHTPELAEEE